MLKFNPHTALALILATACGLSFTSCSHDRFEVKGVINGAPEKSLILEKADYSGHWIAVDSVRTSGSGKYSLKFAAPAAPEVFRLGLDGQYVYFPVQSHETITLDSEAQAFASAFTLSGSQQASDLMDFEKEAIGLAGVSEDSVTSFKRKVYNLYVKEGQGSLVSYYILTKTIGGKPLYDPTDASDIKYYAAVATSFRQYKPEDPRTELLEHIALEGMKHQNSIKGKQGVIQAQEITILDIDLPSVDGRNRKLSDMVGKGKPVVVAFTALGADFSPAANRELADLRKNHGGSPQVYMVCLDQDQRAWKEAASNLPWTCVFVPEGLASKSLTDYNVSQIPTYFIYNSAGELAARTSTVAEITRFL